MTDAQVRSDMEALMTRLVQKKRALTETQQVPAGPKVSAPLADMRTIGKAPTFTGEHKDWPERSCQPTAFMGSANPKSIGALRWAPMQDANSRSGRATEF